MTTSVLGAAASVWIRRFMGLIPAGSAVLDLACGSGRHASLLAAAGFRVEAVDRDARALSALDGIANVSVRQTDLENGRWPYRAAQFAGIVVANYLFRPRLPELFATLGQPGVLIYETFMAGNERYGRPSRREFLLESQEMLTWARQQGWRVIAFEEGYVDRPKPAIIQRLCAVRGELPETGECRAAKTATGGSVMPVPSFLQQV